MRREAPVRFLGGGGAAMHCCYPTKADYAKYPIMESCGPRIVRILATHNFYGVNLRLDQVQMAGFGVDS
jgi:hypothetical protein